MQNVDKVIRIEIDSDLFQENLSSDVTEWWFDLYDLKEHEEIYNYVLEYDKDIIKQLENGVDYLSVYIQDLI